MRGVAIGADSRFRVTFLQNFLAMYRRDVLVAFLAVALASNVWNAQAPL
jgi:hypothetical protein